MDATEILLSKTEDAVRSCRRGITQYIGFLDEKEFVLLSSVLRNKKDVEYTFWGGYENASRVFLAVSKQEEVLKSSFPIVPILFKFRKNEDLSHRDFLGSLMGLNISRDSVGDICIDSTYAVVFVREEVAPVVLDEITKVGNQGVSTEIGLPEKIPPEHCSKIFNGITTSLRLDCVLAMLIAQGRKQAQMLIDSGMCTLNFEVCKNTSKMVRMGDTISVRGHGKFKVGQVTGETHKGRLKISFEKYI